MPYLRSQNDCTSAQGQERTAEEGEAMNNKELKLTRLTQLIRENPSWGRRRLAKALCKEYPHAFRMTTIARIKDETLLTYKIPTKKPLGKRPYAKIRKTEIKGVPLLPERFMKEEVVAREITIGFESAYHMMRSNGFLDFEIKEFFTASGVIDVFNSKTFKAMLRGRRSWVRDLLRKGWPKARIIKEIEDYYKPADRSVFDFLRANYLSKKKDFIRYRKAQQRRAASKTKKLYKRARVRAW